MEKQMLSTLLPFSGFYYSWHDNAFDNEMEGEFGGHDGKEWAGALQSRLFDCVDWHAAQTKYAKAYAEALARELHADGFEFEEMVSPREYNFGTDRIFGKFDAAFLQSLFDSKSIRDRLNTVAAEMFTSRSGFISFYSPDVSSWPAALPEWDANQRGALLQAACDVLLNDGENFSQEEEFAICEDFSGNGDIGNWIWGAADKKTRERLYKIHTYLETRESR